MEPLDPAATTAVRELLEQCVEAWQEQGPHAAEALLAARPDLAGPVRDGLAALARAGFLDEPAAGPDDDGPARLPKTIGGYRIKELLGRGGMGAVFLAHDDAADRDVAIKVVHPQLLWYGRARERFQREVRALARLSHRGVVAIHHFGDDDGVPFFVMEHVHGASLAQTLAKVAGRDPATLTSADLHGADPGPAVAASAGKAPPVEAWWRAVVRIVVQVADALHYAHRHQIVHRDIKPSNILVTPDGTARVVDFGLSRAEGESELTRSQTTIGSEPYMAPEQFGDGGAVVDGRADVFALGATMYEALALRPPFGSGGARTRDRIRAGDCQPLQRVVAGLPRDLAAVCAVALDPEPRRRYASAGAFADDLRAVLEGRPVQARPIGWLTRLLRQARRHPVAALAVLVITLALTVGPALFAWQQYEASQRIGRALARAEQNRDHALNAVDRLLGRFAQERLFDLPGVEEARLHLLEDAIELQQAILADQPDDMNVRLRYAAGKFRLAKMRGWLGEHEAAERENDEALALLRTFRIGHEAILADTLALRSKCAMRRGDYDTARASVTESLAILDGVVQKQPELSEPRLLAAQRRIDLAVLEGWAGNEDVAEAELAQAMTMLRQLDADPRTLQTIGNTLAEQVKVAASRNDLPRAIRLTEAALAAYDDALAAQPGDWYLAATRAGQETTLAKLCFDSRDFGRARQHAQAATDALEQLWHEHEHVTWLRFDYCDAKAALADALWRQGERERALACLDEALQGGRELVQQSPRSNPHREFLAICLGTRANWIQDPAAALLLLDEAQQIFDQRFAEQPDNPAIWQQSVVTRMIRAQWTGELGDRAAEAELIDSALAILRPRAAAAGGLGKRATVILASALVARAECALDANDEPAARAFLREGIELGVAEREIAARKRIAALWHDMKLEADK